jgi:hypothetical protein
MKQFIVAFTDKKEINGCSMEKHLEPGAKWLEMSLV